MKKGIFIGIGLTALVILGASPSEAASTVTMTIVSMTKTMDGHIEVRVSFSDTVGKTEFQRDYQFYDVDSAKILETLKEQCRQLATSLDTASKSDALVGKTWNYDLKAGTLAEVKP